MRLLGQLKRFIFLQDKTSQVQKRIKTQVRCFCTKKDKNISLVFLYQMSP